MVTDPTGYATLDHWLARVYEACMIGWLGFVLVGVVVLFAVRQRLSPRPTSPSALYARLVRSCHHDREQVERLIRFEQNKHGCDRDDAIALAYARLADERGRRG